MRYAACLILLIFVLSCTTNDSSTGLNSEDSFRTPDINIGESNRQRTIPFQGITLNDTNFHIDQTLGSPTLLIFWAPW